MFKTVLEAAALIGVVTAAIAGSVYALGTVAYLSYLDGLGFDAHQFPPLGAELHVTGFVYSLLPALYVGLLALAYGCAVKLSNLAADWMNRNPTPAK